MFYSVPYHHQNSTKVLTQTSPKSERIKYPTHTQAQFRQSERFQWGRLKLSMKHNHLNWFYLVEHSSKNFQLTKIQGAIRNFSAQAWSELCVDSPGDSWKNSPSRFLVLFTCKFDIQVTKIKRINVCHFFVCSIDILPLPSNRFSMLIWQVSLTALSCRPTFRSISPMQHRR